MPGISGRRFELATKLFGKEKEEKEEGEIAQTEDEKGDAASRTPEGFPGNEHLGTLLRTLLSPEDWIGSVGDREEEKGETTSEMSGDDRLK